MDTKFKFTGAPGHVGRFGYLATNDIIPLTEAEALTIQADSRFEPMGAAIAAVEMTCVDDNAKIAVRVRKNDGEYSLQPVTV